MHYSKYKACMHAVYFSLPISLCLPLRYHSPIGMTKIKTIPMRMHAAPIAVAPIIMMIMISNPDNRVDCILVQLQYF